MLRFLAFRAAMLAAVVLVTAGFDGSAPGFKQPPQAVLDVIDAPPIPTVSLSPLRDRMLVVGAEQYPPLSALADQVHRLAGIKINPATGARRRVAGITTLALQAIDEAAARPVALPPGGRFGMPIWSDDGAYFALTREMPIGVQLWLGEARGGTLRQIPGVRLNDVLGATVRWLPGGHRLVARTIEQGRGTPPKAPRTPAGPNVEETAGRRAELRTFQDLLKTPHDAALFEHYARAQLVVIDAATGRSAPLGKPDLIAGIDPSPDGRYWLVTRLVKPFSFAVPASSFARTVEVWDQQGKPIKTIASLPIADEVPRQGVETGPRGIGWVPLLGETGARGAGDAKSTLLWVEALDGGDPVRKAEHRDKLMLLEAPFGQPPREVLKLKHRFAGADWLAKPGTALMSEFDRERRWITTRHVDIAAPQHARTIFDRSVNDAYSDPGSPVYETRKSGQRVVLQDGDAIFLAGSGASPSGEKPFLDRLDLATGQKTRLYQADDRSYERFIAFRRKDRQSEIITRRESIAEAPNYFLVDLTTGARRALTSFEDPSPALRQIKRELITYKRADGVPLSGMLYLPPGYQSGTKLPALVWAYPLEFSDAGTAGQVRGAPNRFWLPAGTSPIFLALQGYAVLMDAAMPVVGDPETVNNTFVEQITADAKAAIDKLDEMGVIDPRRVIVGGHSYGAFMTANLLAHTDLFAAGIARSGAYNRTLTPFGFQGERRSYWEATDLYTKVSPFTHAHKINEPLLLIHGEADTNPGTFPIQSERLYQAIRGTGGTARLVTLPHEDHGYISREAVLHVLAETIGWADRWTRRKSGADGSDAAVQSSGPTSGQR